MAKAARLSPGANENCQISAKAEYRWYFVQSGLHRVKLIGSSRDPGSVRDHGALESTSSSVSVRTLNDHGLALRCRLTSTMGSIRARHWGSTRSPSSPQPIVSINIKRAVSIASSLKS